MIARVDVVGAPTPIRTQKTNTTGQPVLSARLALFFLGKPLFGMALLGNADEAVRLPVQPVAGTAD